MTAHTRTFAAVVFAGAATAGLSSPRARRRRPPSQVRRLQRHAAADAPADSPQFTRELAPQDVLVRGKGLYEANCASGHATDLRGSDKGANLLRSGVALADQHGERIAPALGCTTRR